MIPEDLPREMANLPLDTLVEGAEELFKLRIGKHDYAFFVNDDHCIRRCFQQMKEFLILKYRVRTG